MSELTEYISDARSSGLLDDQIRDQLRGAGWDTVAITEAFSLMPSPSPSVPAVGPLSQAATAISSPDLDVIPILPAIDPTKDKDTQEAERQRRIDAQVARYRERERQTRRTSGKASAIGGVVMAVIGLCTLGFSWFLYLQEHDLQERGVVAAGVVDRIEERTEVREDDDGHRRETTYYQPIYSFTDQDGAAHSFAGGSSSGNTRRVGQPVSVLYDPLHPGNARIAGGVPYIGAIMTVVMGIGLLVTGTIATVIIRRRNRQMEASQDTEGTPS